jgi:hypothetical protein
VEGIMEAAKNAKVYVNVLAEFALDGQMLPRRLTWEDGAKYKIDKIINICQAAAMKSGGQGDRYTVMIQGQQSYLFFERTGNIGGNNIGRWFVERK